MRKSYKYRIYPTPAQITILNSTLESCRWVYNETLNYRKTLWEEKQENCSKYDTHKILTKWKQEKLELYKTDSQVLQNVQERVDFAFRNFFRRVKAGDKPGYPRFKSFGRYDSITYPYCIHIRYNGEAFLIPKIGWVKTVYHREIPDSATIKRYTLKRENDKWFLIFSVIDEPSQIKSCGSGTVGIDLGIKTYAVLSDGNKIENPKYLSKSQKRLSKAHRRVSSKPKCSLERKKARKVLGKIYQKVNNQRNDFLHKESRKLVNKYENIIFEKLNIHNMVEDSNKHSLNSSISDTGWDKFVFFTSYKAENAGGKVVLVNSKNTTETCSRCGTIKEMSLNERTYYCPSCLLEIDRDFNASVNILRLGYKSLVTKVA